MQIGVVSLHQGVYASCCGGIMYEGVSLFAIFPTCVNTWDHFLPISLYVYPLCNLELYK